MAPKSETISPLKGAVGLEQKNLRIIKEKLAGKLEWQLLTISYLDDLEAQATGTKMKRKLSKSFEEVAEEADQNCLDIPEGVSLGRSGKKYVNWSKKMLQEMLHFAEPSVFRLAACKVDSVQLLRQLLEFGMGVRCLDKTTSDVCQVNDKKVTFEALKALYVTRGNRFKGLTIKDGMIDWCADGEFRVETEASGSDAKVTVKVTEKFTGKVAYIPEEFLASGFKGATNQDIQFNFNHADAHVSLGKDKELFNLAELFPKTRTLKRKVSDALGATGGTPEGDQQPTQPKPEQKRIAKPKLAARKVEEEIPEPEDIAEAETAAIAAAAGRTAAANENEEHEGEDPEEEEPVEED